MANFRRKLERPMTYNYIKGFAICFPFCRPFKVSLRGGDLSFTLGSHDTVVLLCVYRNTLVNKKTKDVHFHVPKM